MDRNRGLVESMAEAKSHGIVQGILSVASEEFEKSGLNKTTMNSIARNAGKSKSTLYHYFESKEEIFREVVKLEMDKIFSEVNLAVMDAGSCKEQFQAFIITKTQLLRNKQNLFNFVFRKDVHSEMVSDLVEFLHHRYTRREEQLIQTILINGVQEGLFTIEMNRLQLLSELLVACIRGIEYDFFIRRKSSTLETEIDFLMCFLFNAVQTKTDPN